MWNFFKKCFGQDTKLSNQKIGQMGESYCTDYLKDKHYFIICRNFRNKLGEVDIIAQTDKVLVFIEVKTREQNLLHGRPAEAVTHHKQLKIRQIAESYIQKNPKNTWERYRFDVMEVITDQNGNLLEINHLENAF